MLASTSTVDRNEWQKTSLVFGERPKPNGGSVNGMSPSRPKIQNQKFDVYDSIAEACSTSMWNREPSSWLHNRKLGRKLDVAFVSILRHDTEAK